ncbi:hypothetical protein [Actinoplanes sp. N902-109]|uniref:hypothetical protein n=1 Tax=Actinoplanes sp. (strain N902-109) TaxID=649831 RepID=UPI00032948E8|nr:hypothetical protein [Actinoplanes sp. N902-109]AGL16051.1 hypothetical protein L083_2541 [Actinoplanes sp. N902-109]
MNPDEAVLLLVLAILVLVVARQLTARRVRPVAYLWVVLLIARACVPPGPAMTTLAGIGVLIVGLLGSVAFGILRGATISLWRDEDGRLYRKGGRVTVLLWLATIVTRVLISAIGMAVFNQPFNLNAIWLGLGVTLGAQHAATMYRGRLIPTPQPSEVR